LVGNPGNALDGVETVNSGYAFEILAKVKGTPEHCREIQLVKWTLQPPGVGAIYAPVKIVMEDRDLNGFVDLDASTAASCEEGGGFFDPLTRGCTFPQSGNHYGPDGENAYKTRSSWKNRPDKKIIWYDTACISGFPNGTTYKADFVAIVRGSGIANGKYCYVKFSLNVEKKVLFDKEELTQTDKQIGADSVPGVP
jgi:hypothetical protein